MKKHLRLSMNSALEMLQMSFAKICSRLVRRLLHVRWQNVLHTLHNVPIIHTILNDLLIVVIRHYQAADLRLAVIKAHTYM